MTKPYTRVGNVVVPHRFIFEMFSLSSDNCSVLLDCASDKALGASHIH